MAAPATAHEILDVNRRYHDVAARRLRRQVGHRLRRGRPGAGARQAHQAARPDARARTRARSRSARAPATSRSTSSTPGVVEHATCTDISPGMLETLEANARKLGREVETAACDAAELPFHDASFDLVLGHAVLHHLPDARALVRGVRARAAPRRDAVLRRRALAPGRPHRRLAEARRHARRAAVAAGGAGAARAFASNGGPPSPDDAEHALESVVDVHAFDPGDLQRLMQGAGFADTRVQGEELLANWFGWFNRTLEASANHDDIPMPWFQFAFRGYLGAAEGRPRAARAAAAAAGLLQPDDRGAQAVSVDVARARADTPGTESVAHLNNAGAALPPAPVLDAVIEHLRLRGGDRRLRGGRRPRGPRRAHLRRDRAADRRAAATRSRSSRTPRARGTWRSTR